MSRHVYLIKDNDDLISHCDCEMAYITFPPQMDCPWCGCGWLFSCIECRKAFTFARGVEVDEPWEELGRRDCTNRSGEPPDEDEVQEWVGAMQELLAEVEVGRRYVCLDGLIIPADAAGVEFEGWHARHNLEFLPQVAALDDPSIIDSLLANPDYWQSNALEVEEE